MFQPWSFPCNLFFFFLFSSSYVLASSEPSPSPMEMSNSHLSASSKAKLVKAIAATAATTLVIALVVFFFFFFFRKIERWRWWKRGKYESSFRREAVVIPDEFMKYGEKVKGLVVEENGRDVLCMTKPDHDRRLKNEFPKVMFNPSYEEDEGEKTVERSKKSKSREDFQFLDQPSDVILPPVSTTLPPEPSPAMVSMKKTTPNPPPPPPPPPSITPPAPLNQARTNSAAPHPPPAKSISVPVLKPPTAPRGTTNNRDRPNTSPENRRGAGFGQLKLRPLHWDKVIADSDHSMVWDQIKEGSLR